MGAQSSLIWSCFTKWQGRCTFYLPEGGLFLNNMLGVWLSTPRGDSRVSNTPSFASWYAISLSKVPLFALTFCIVMLCLVHRIWCTMAKISSFWCTMARCISHIIQANCSWRENKPCMGGKKPIVTQEQVESTLYIYTRTHTHTHIKWRKNECFNHYIG